MTTIIDEENETEQAIHRIIRLGQKKNMSIYFPVYMEYEENDGLKTNGVDGGYIRTVMEKAAENRRFIRGIISERREHYGKDDGYAEKLEKYAIQDFPFKVFPKILDMEKLYGLHKNDGSR